MTNKEWLNSMGNKELASLINENDTCDFCIRSINGDCNSERCTSSEYCEKGIVEWLKKKHVKPLPILKAGDIVQTKPYCRYVAIDSTILVRAESKERVFLCDIGDIIMIWRSEGAEYQCIWEG